MIPNRFRYECKKSWGEVTADSKEKAIYKIRDGHFCCTGKFTDSRKPCNICTDKEIKLKKL